MWGGEMKKMRKDTRMKALHAEMQHSQVEWNTHECYDWLNNRFSHGVTMVQLANWLGRFTSMFEKKGMERVKRPGAWQEDSWTIGVWWAK